MGKKSGKGRLDKYYHLAKDQGYRARSAFKLIQIDKKFNLLAKAKVCIDLCAAPGGWLQVAAKYMPVERIIVGVDLDPIKPISNVVTFQQDITTAECREKIRGCLRTWKADLVLHDGAPNVGMAWIQDAYDQNVLVLTALKLATEFLIPGGSFVSKLFRSKDYNKLMWVFGQLFKTVEATKPMSSRYQSAEIFVICRGYKAPGKLDPKFLDPQTVFDEVNEPKIDTSVNLLKSANAQKRYRQGYEDGVTMLYKDLPIEKFIERGDHIKLLATHNKFTFETEEGVRIAKDPLTTPDIIHWCQDLKVIAQKEFRRLARWRMKLRKMYGMEDKPEKNDNKEAVEESPPKTEEEVIDEELEHLNAVEAAKKRRERRKVFDSKRKATNRMQKGMQAAADIALEQDLPGFRRGLSGEIFDLKSAERVRLSTDAAPEHYIASDGEESVLSDLHSDADTDTQNEQLEADLNRAYEQLKAARRAANFERDDEDDLEVGEEEFMGVSEDDGSEDDDVDVTDDDNDEDRNYKLTTELRTPFEEGYTESGLSKDAAMFFMNPEFKEFGLEGTSGPEPSLKPSVPTKLASVESPPSLEDDLMEEEDEQFDSPPENEEAEDWEEKKRDPSKKPDIDIVTAEAMVLARQIAEGKKTMRQLEEDSYTRRSFQDNHPALPIWFREEEEEIANAVEKPLNKAAIAALQQKLRAINARPNKKVLEAKAKKRQRRAKIFDKMTAKAEGMLNKMDMTEREKADSIFRMMKSAKSRVNSTRRTQFVVARGGRTATISRPRGIKGRYKMLDPRMKKELRAKKRIAKRKK